MIACVQSITHWYVFSQSNFIIVRIYRISIIVKFDQIKRPSVESFIIIGRVSSEALIEEKLSHAKSLFGLLHVWLEEISLQARFFIMQVALWMLQFRTALAL